jgi:hypothetical protein
MLGKVRRQALLNVSVVLQSQGFMGGGEGKCISCGGSKMLRGPSSGSMALKITAGYLDDVLAHLSRTSLEA